MDGGKRTASHPCSYFTQFDHPISSRSLIRSSYKFFWGGLPSSCIKSFNACYIRIKNVNKCKLPLCRSLCNPPNISKLFLTNPHQIPTDSRRNNLTEEYTGNRSSICWFPFNPIALGPPSRLFVGHTWIPLWRWIGLILSSTHDMNFLKSESTSQICRVSKIELFLAFTSSVGLKDELSLSSFWFLNPNFIAHLHSTSKSTRSLFTFYCQHQVLGGRHVRPFPQFRISFFKLVCRWSWRVTALWLFRRCWEISPWY